MKDNASRGKRNSTWGWLLILLLGPPTAALLYAFWPYPEARGVQRLITNVNTEYALLHRLEPGSVARARGLDAGLHELFFRRTGLDSLLRNTKTPQGGGELLAASWTHAFSPFLLTLRYSLRLVALRLGVLLGVVPLFLAAALYAILDGAATRRLRQLRAARESAFLYHRFKLALSYSLWGLATCYLLPPIPLDPRWLIPPFFFAFSLSLRLTTASFKKYL